MADASNSELSDIAEEEEEAAEVSAATWSHKSSVVLFHLVHFNVLKIIFLIQLTIVTEICKRLSKNGNEI